MDHPLIIREADRQCSRSGLRVWLNLDGDLQYLVVSGRRFYFRRIDRDTSAHFSPGSRRKRSSRFHSNHALVSLRDVAALLNVLNFRRTFTLPPERSVRQDQSPANAVVDPADNAIRVKLNPG